MNIYLRVLFPGLIVFVKFYKRNVYLHMCVSLLPAMAGEQVSTTLDVATDVSAKGISCTVTVKPQTIYI